MSDISSPAYHIAASPDPVTQSLQRMIDTVPPGQVVSLGPGAHWSGGLRLRSDMVLHLEAGAILNFLPDYAAYSHTSVSVVAEQSNRAMLMAEGASNLSITGPGRIRCNGSAACSRGVDAAMGTLIPVAQRPRVLVLDHCSNVRLDGLVIEDAPMWTLHFVACSGVDLKNLCIDNNRLMPNTDGIVIDGCRDVAIRDCDIRTADDGIVLKTSHREDGTTTGPCEGVRVADCHVESRSCALKLGTESHDDFRDITFERIRITASNRAIGLFSRDGGAMEGITFRDIEVECHETPNGFWGSGEALTVNTLDRDPGGRPSGAIRDLLVEDLRGRMEGAINLVRAGQGEIDRVTLHRIILQQAPGPLGTARALDLRPTALDRLPCDDAHGRVNAWRFDAEGGIVGCTPYPGGMPGLYVRGITNLATKAVDLLRPDPLPDGFHPHRTVIEQGET